jgi:tRNA uracil 4-sulfurtransferase
MEDLWLIKIGEITLKKGNRAFFERILKQNIKMKLRDSGIEGGSRVDIRAGRYYLLTDADEDVVAPILSKTPGIVSFSRARKTDKTVEALSSASLEVARSCLADGVGNRFKFEVRRTDKSLPLDSYGYARELGGMLQEALPELVVDVRKPDFTVKVELREKGYVYGRERRGPGGLPVGTGGRGMLLLSGGIDSPVAGYLMAKRGIALSAVHFHTPPFTSPESHDKVVRLASTLAPWCGGLTLFSVPFTECQVKVNQSVDPSATTLHTRASMMKIAKNLAASRKCKALVTGEALGQVASQTMESMAFTGSFADLPVFRPLIGYDKEEIITLAKGIGTYETAIEPYDDCCVLFSPEKPLTRPDLAEERAVHEGIEGLDPLIEKAAEEAEIRRFDSTGKEVEIRERRRRS